MKKLFIITVSFILLFITTVSAEYNSDLNKDPVFMENVYSFIQTEDSTSDSKLSYCEEVYLEATRRREYTDYEVIRCGEYFIQKNKEEMAYMNYMFNNRELFY